MYDGHPHRFAKKLGFCGQLMYQADMVEQYETVVRITNLRLAMKLILRLCRRGRLTEDGRDTSGSKRRMLPCLR